MASHDIDGSVIVILTEKEARCVFRRLATASLLDGTEQGLFRKIVRDLKIEGNEYRGHRRDVMDNEGLTGGELTPGGVAMYTSPNFKTKKALKEAVAAGKVVTIFQPGPFGGHEPDNGTIAVEGPHAPMAHTWYAQVTLREGRVVKVK